MGNKKELSSKQNEELLITLKARFESNMCRHKNVIWSEVKTKLEANPQKLWSLSKMEESGGEPDLMCFDKKSNEYVFVDCSEESPTKRRSVCYDTLALDSRKENKPKNSAIAMALEIGIELLTEEQYHELQQTGSYDTKTSSWIATPERIRELGGAIFGDCRYGQVFIYHNGAESYYATRGFRGSLRI